MAPVSDDIKHSESLSAAFPCPFIEPVLAANDSHQAPKEPFFVSDPPSLTDGVLVLAFRRQTNQRPVFAVGIAFDEFGQLPIKRRPFPCVVKPD